MISCNYIFFGLIIILLCITPVIAIDNPFNITLSDERVVYYIDYGETVYVTLHGYNMTTTVTLPDPVQDWSLSGSNNGVGWTTLDTELNKTFTANVAQPYAIASPGVYQYYRLYMEEGFYVPGETLTLTLTTTQNSTGVIPTATPTLTPVVPTPTLASDTAIINQTVKITAEVGEKYIQWCFSGINGSSPPPLNIYLDDNDQPTAINYTGSTFLMSGLSPGERHNIRVYNSSALYEGNVSVFVAKATAKTSNAGYEVMFLIALNLLLGVLLFILKDIRYLICLSVLNIVISIMGMSLAGGTGLSYYIFIGVAVITFIILLVNGIPRLREEVDWS